MKAYSLDLREKIVHAYETKVGSIRKIAEIFHVHKSTGQNPFRAPRLIGSLGDCSLKKEHSETEAYLLSGSTSPIKLCKKLNRCCIRDLIL